MRVVSIVGARPQFVKLGPIVGAVREADVEHLIIHTGQHYDVNMSDNFFRDLQIPAPDVHLGVGSGSHGVQTGRILAELDDVLDQLRPDVVLAYGDTNSTLAAAISSVKLNIPVAHLEAGLRSFNRKMPEEHNRVLTDHAADLCLAPTVLAMRNLEKEGLASRSVLTGDVMTDVCLATLESVRAPGFQPAELPPDGQFILSTLHRPANTDDPARLLSIVRALAGLPQEVVLTAHPRLRAKAKEANIDLSVPGITLIDPLDYPQLVEAVDRAAFVVTDSGGLQKEAFLIRTPCVTVRTETEWIETVDLGWNVLCEDPSLIESALAQLKPDDTALKPYGEGRAAVAAVEAMRIRYEL
ncbi:non-hydrolyzing UDP-N-acetylglucosamine 2-epimerase [Dietzia kunjamensis]|uniref:non-hydrolyzing UDP-N-acetylglucosamine 2-epimerase n=1 Tax=Dietzia kunjamensis TaxID=322509 RepID=UPI002096E2D7|nr:UDP-N-acetylglucosamine 2-epimerase (non-hydrolyzing) [Dietzia kunjamensis]USX45196.1 UDP-N-acetylglucosamine 2-epimerase (non-hydrolyzing) [Dietzia kunjamensis]